MPHCSKPAENKIEFICITQLSKNFIHHLLNVSVCVMAKPIRSPVMPMKNNFYSFSKFYYFITTMLTSFEIKRNVNDTGEKYINHEIQRYTEQ